MVLVAKGQWKHPTSNIQSLKNPKSTHPKKHPAKINRGHYMTPTQMPCIVKRADPSKLPHFFVFFDFPKMGGI